MRRRELITGLGAGAVSWPLVVRGQQRVRQIGALLLGVIPEFSAFIHGLETFGWIEGRNTNIEVRTHTGDTDEMHPYAAELVRLSPDVILAATTIEAKALRQETSTIPIVFAAGIDPVNQGIVDSFARPGGNVTGCSSFESSMGGKWVQGLKEMAPDVKHIGIVFNPQTASFTDSIVHSVEAAAGPLQVRISAIPVNDIAELERMVASLAQEPNHAMIVPPDIFLSAKIKAIIALAAQYRLPAAYSVPTFAKYGGLLAYGPDFFENYLRAAKLVDRILKGAKPSDLPIEQPTKFVLAINLKTATALGLTIPPALLLRADEVIE
jgi:putative ABC transport system substrate-binding protein